jgi:hypothetical protein
MRQPYCDIVGCAGRADQNGGIGGLGQAARGIDQRQIGDRRHHQHAGKQQPGHTLAQPTDQRQADAIHDPGPQPFKIIDEEGQGEGGHGLLVDAILRQPRRQRRADHRIREARRHAEEEGRQRRLFHIGFYGIQPVAAALHGVGHESARPPMASLIRHHMACRPSGKRPLRQAGPGISPRRRTG